MSNLRRGNEEDIPESVRALMDHYNQPTRQPQHKASNSGSDGKFLTQPSGNMIRIHE